MIFSFKILSLSSIPHSPLIQMSQPDLGTYVPNTAFSQQPHLLKTPSKIYTFYKWLLVLKSCYPDLFLKFLKMTQPIRSAYHYHYCIQGIQNWLKKEQQLPLHPQMKSLFMAHPALPIKGTIVFFHGYSAGTWQFEHWATHFFNKGYNVFVPRLSGHGFQSAAHAETAQYLPQSQQWTVFQSFSNEILDLVKQFDAPLFLAGLSGGGAIATYSAACHSEVSKLVVFSPFFKPNTPVGKKVFDVVSFL